MSRVRLREAFARSGHALGRLALVEPGKEHLAGSTPAEHDDRALIEAMLRRDNGAEALFYDRIRPGVHRIVLHLLGRRDADYDDLVQLSSIELVYSLDRFRGDCSLDGWAATITSHVVWKHIRRRLTEKRIFASSDDDDLAASRANPASDAMWRGMLGRVRLHLAGMKVDHASAFVLHDVCGYDVAEVAQIVGASVAATQARVVRGRRELHRRIENDPELADFMEGGRR